MTAIKFSDWTIDRVGEYFLHVSLRVILLTSFSIPLANNPNTAEVLLSSNGSHSIVLPFKLDNVRTMAKKRAPV